MSGIKRTLGRRITIPLGTRRVAIPIVLLILLICCCGPLSLAIIDSGIRQAGLLPTYTPAPTATTRLTATAKPTRTSQPSATPELASTPRPTATGEPTIAPLPTVEKEPTPIPLAVTDVPVRAAPLVEIPTPTGPTAAENGNLRAGPGTGFAKSGSVAVGQPLEIVGKTPAGDWYELAGGAWIAAFLVAGSPDVSVSASIPVLPTRAPAAVAPTPKPQGEPFAGASSCDCSANTLNCDDFIAWDAQACYLRCMELTGQDIHDLDRDHDGSACEWTY